MKWLLIFALTLCGCGSDDAEGSGSGSGGAQCDELPAGCCSNDADCEGSDMRCYFAFCEDNGVAGVCKPIPDQAGMCWDGRDCGPNENCQGAQACCECFAAEIMGTCEPV